MVCKLLLPWNQTSVRYSDYIQIEITAFHPTKKKRNGFFCVNLHRSSFRRESLVLRRVLTGGAASCRGLHPPWSQPAQEASLSSLHPSWKLLLISKCQKFHTPLSLGALAKGGEHRGGEKGKEMMHSFFLSPSPLRRKLDVGTQHNLLWVKSLFPFEVLELNMKPLHRQEQASCWYSKGFTVLLMSDGARALSADIHFGFICWAWHTQTLITSYCFVTPMLTREIAAVLNCNIIPALPLPQGTAYELMRCQQRCHVFIHSISPKEKKTPPWRNWYNVAPWISSVFGGLTLGGFIPKNARSSCFLMTAIHLE